MVAVKTNESHVSLVYRCYSAVKTIHFEINHVILGQIQDSDTGLLQDLGLTNVPPHAFVRCRSGFLRQCIFEISEENITLLRK